VGRLGGFNQISLKKILTYSSIIHAGWIISIIFHRILIWLYYFFIYSLITFRVIHLIFFLNINNIKSLSTFKANKTIKNIFLLNIISLGGLPPLLGFISKFLALSILFSLKFRIPIILILISSSIVGLFFYLKIIYAIIIVNTSHINFFYLMLPIKNYSWFISCSVFINLILPLLIFIF